MSSGALTYHKSLDGLRAFAVLIVMVAHAGLWLPSGGIGVDVFFVLSGFLITTILRADVSNFGRVDVRTFYIRRLLRLAPCLVVTCILLAVLAWLAGAPFPAFDIVASLTYTGNWVRALEISKMGGMGHVWSLAIEEQYYLVWPWIVLLLERKVPGDRQKGVALVGLAVTIAAYRAIAGQFYSVERTYFGLDTHSDGLVLGSALAYLTALSHSQPMSEGFFRLTSRVLVPASIVTLIAVSQLLVWWNPWMGRVGFFAVAVASAVLVFDLVRSPVSWLRPILEKQPLVWIGRISYGLYLLHFPIFKYIEASYPALTPEQAAVPKFAFAFLAAAISFPLIERPFLRLKRHFRPGSRINVIGTLFEKLAPRRA